MTILKMLQCTVLSLFLAFAATALAAQEQFAAPVISVADSDTITVLTKGIHQIKIRLYGIDCPERGREFWSRAKQATVDAVHGKSVSVLPMDTDRYGRTVAVVLMPGGKSLNQHLVREGLAWVSQKYCTQDDICAPLRKLERSAKAEKRGMWADKTSAEPGWTLVPGGVGGGTPGEYTGGRPPR